MKNSTTTQDNSTNLEEHTSPVTSHLSKCVDVVLSKAIKLFPNQKYCMNGQARTLSTFQKAGKVTRKHITPPEFDSLAALKQV